MSISMTFGAQAGAKASASLAASASATFDLDFSAKYGGRCQVKNTGGGSVSATNGLKVEAFGLFGAGPTADTIAFPSFTITTVVSTANYQSFELPPGKWRVKLTNLDASNAVTVEATTWTTDTL